MYLGHAPSERSHSRTGYAPYSLLDEPTLIAWYDPRATGALDGSGNVQSWPSQKAGVVSLAQSDATRRMAPSATAIAGTPGLLCAGGQMLFADALAASLGATTTVMTFVARQQASTAGVIVAIAANDDTTDNALESFYLNSQLYGVCNDAVDGASAVGADNQSPHVWSVVRVDNTVSLRKDGEQIASATSGHTLGTLPFVRFSVGSQRVPNFGSGMFYPLTGAIGHVALFVGLPSLAKVEKYLMSVSGL